MPRDDHNTPRSATDSTAARQPYSWRGAADICLSAFTYWYVTGLIAAIGFSFGYYLVRPGSPSGGQTRDWLAAFNWEDGGWYSQIAADGYKYQSRRRSNVAFFPAYPLLGRALAAVTGLRAEAALLIVSNLSLFGALTILAFYVRDRYPEEGDELRDCVLLAAALFPTGCFFRLAYSESTFLLVAVLAMYAMLRRWPLWATAAIVGAATATRPVGLALLAPFAIHIWRRSLAEHETKAFPTDPVGQSQRTSAAGGEAVSAAICRAGEQAGRWSRRRRFSLFCARLVLYLPLACWGVGLFMAYQYRSFGEPLAFVKVQTNWGFPAPWREKAVALATLKPIWSAYDPKSRAFWLNRDHHALPWLSLHFANPIFFVCAAVLVGIGAFVTVKGPKNGADGRARSLSLEEIVLAASLLAIPYVTRGYEMGMGSMGRFVAVVFPVYLVLGHLLSRAPAALRALLLAFSGCLLLIFIALYAARHLIY